MMNYESYLSAAGKAMRESAIRQMGTILAQNRHVISFAPGYPDPDTFPWTEFTDIAHELLSGSHGSALQYGPTRGFRPLLETIAGIMQHRGVAPALERLLVTTGSQQGLDLVARVLLDPGDVVLVELPTYTGAITAFRNVRAHMEGVPQDEDGIDLQALDRIHGSLVSGGRRVRVLYLVPNFQNPTGLLISREKRRQLLEWAALRDLLIVEDDPYRELYFTDSAAEADVRPMKADDSEGRVVYLSSFSKTLAPGFRVAWIDAPAPLAVKLEMAKQAGDLCTGILDQRIVYEAARRGVLERQLPVLRGHYAAKRDVMVASLRQELGDTVSWPAPRGGFFLWATLPDGVDADRLLSRAVQHGVVYVAGSAFFVTAGGADRIRLSFSAPAHDVIREGVKRLAAAIREEQAQQVPAGGPSAPASSSPYGSRSAPP
jgi:2-aminoadipate transaminase